MNLNKENLKPAECQWCHFKFPSNDNMRWSLYNINKHIKACQEKHLEIEQQKKTLNNLKKFNNFL